jgi:hypothetical protein
LRFVSVFSSLGLVGEFQLLNGCEVGAFTDHELVVFDAFLQVSGRLTEEDLTNPAVLMVGKVPEQGT